MLNSNVTHSEQNGKSDLSKIDISTKLLISVHRTAEDAKKANINTYEGKPDTDTVGTFQSDSKYKAVAYTNQQFIDYVLAGGAFYPSNKVGDAFESNVIVFDIDDENGQGEYPVNSLLSNHFLLCYPSPSFVKGKNSKHRVVIPLSREVSSTEKLYDDLDVDAKLLDQYKEEVPNSLYKAIVRQLACNFPLYEVTEVKGGKEAVRKERYDHASERMRQFYFGCRKRFKEEVIINLEADVIDVDLMKEALTDFFTKPSQGSLLKKSLPGLKHLPSPIDSSDDEKKHPGQGGFFARVDKFVEENIWHRKCVVDGEYDLNKFYNLYEHNFQDWSKHDRDPSKIINCKGHNFGGNGTGAWAYMEEGYGLPLYMNTRDGRGYKWTRYALDGGKYRGDLPQDLTLKGKDFDVVAAYFFQQHEFTYKREDFLIKRTEDEIEKLEKLLKKRCIDYYHKEIVHYIKRCKWDSKAFRYYTLIKPDKSGAAGIWKTESNKTAVLRNTVIPLLDENVITPFYEEYEVFFGKPRQFFTSNVMNEVSQSLDYDDLYETVRDNVSFRLDRNCEVVPLANGQYNWRTKEFTEVLDPMANNTNRYPHVYKPWSADSPPLGQMAFFNWLEAMYTKTEQELIKNYVVLCIHGMASKTERMLNFYGAPKTGKSTLLNMMRLILSDLGRIVNGKNLLSAENRFAYQAIGGKHAVMIDEFRADADGWERIKDLSGNSEALIIEVEKKGETPYEDLLIAGVITCTQDVFEIPKSDDGGVRRRITPIRHTPDKRNEHIKTLALEVLKPENIIDIFIWAIHQNGYEALNQFNHIANTCDEFIESVQTIVIENDPVLQFMAECLEFTNNDEDKISCHQLKTAYEMWLDVVKGEHITDNMKSMFNKVPQWIFEKAKNPDNGFNWQLVSKTKDGKPTPSGLNVRIGGNVVRGHKGIKIKTIESMVDE